jgi:hypothetical protein
MTCSTFSSFLGIPLIRSSLGDGEAGQVVVVGDSARLGKAAPAAGIWIFLHAAARDPDSSGSGWGRSSREN